MHTTTELSIGKQVSRKYRKGLLLSGLLACAVLSGFLTEASAQARQALQGRLDQARVVLDNSGRETLVRADSVRPGDVLEYTVAYKNVSPAAVGNVALTLPIPVGLSYQSHAKLPAPSQASVDGNSFQDMPLKRVVRQADGKLASQLVPMNEYRALRWQIGQLEAGKEVSVIARAQVQNLVVATK